jgi:hypothetical protein
MKIRSLIIIILLLGAVSAAAYFLKSTVLSPKDPVEGRLLFANLPVNEITDFEIKSADHTARLQFSDGRWVVANKFDYPADFNKVNRLLRGLKDAVIIRSLDDSPESLSRLALRDPDSGARAAEEGARVLLKDQNGKVVTSIMIGSERKAPNAQASPGQFVKLPDENKIYLVTGQLYVSDANPVEWVDRMILDIRPDAVKQISCYTNDTNEKIFSYERSEPGKDFESTGPSYNLGPQDVYLIATGLTLLDMLDVTPADPEQTEHLDSPMVFEFVTFDDMVYRIYPSQSSPDSPRGRYSLRIDAACITISGDMECLRRAGRLQERLTPWVFNIDVAHYNRFFPTPQPAPAEAGDRQQ